MKTHQISKKMSETESMKALNVNNSSENSIEDINKKSKFSLQIVSPSVGVPQTLEFRDLSVNLQVKELKALIRNSLDCKPNEKLQRLIHHGRMLIRETDTMLDIFGEEVLNSSEVQVIHLVLPPVPEGISNPITNSKRGNSTQAPPCPKYSSPVRQPAETPVSNSPRILQSQGRQVQQYLPDPQYQQQIVVSELEELQNVMGQRLVQLQRETQRLNQEIQNMGAQALLRTKPIEFHQNETMAQYSSNYLIQQHTPPSDHSKTPSIVQNINHSPEKNQEPQSRGRIDAVLTYEQGSVEIQQSNQSVHDRESSKISAEAWQLSVNEISSNISNTSTQNKIKDLDHRRNSYSDLRSMLRNADRSNIKNQSSNQNHSTAIPEKLRSRVYSSLPTSTSSTSLAVALTPLNPASDSSVGENSEINDVSPRPLTAKKPMVYILSSPTGPRAILMSSTQNFFTPPRNTARFRYTSDVGLVCRNPSTTPDHNRPLRQQAREQRNANEQVENAGPAQPQANLRAGGIRIQVGQLLWLIIRLVVFIWFFTAGNSSWTRWLMAIGFAFIMFIALTGFLSGAVEQVWSPIRRHLEALVPLGPAHNQNVPIQPNGIQAQAREEDRVIPRHLPVDRNSNRIELGSSEHPSRRIEQQMRSNNGFLMTRIRRLEQSLILFVASLVPGVSERHIAHREALANLEAERQQQLLEASAEQAARVNAESSVTTLPESRENTGAIEQSQINSPINQEDAPQAEPLVQL